MTILISNQVHISNMVENFNEYIESVVNNIAQELKLENWKFVVNKFGEIAQNYFGILIPIEICGKIHKSDVVSRNLALKLAPIDERYRVSGAVTIMFAREIFVYSVLLKRYQEIQQKFPMSSRFIAPECYYICKDYCKEVIAMEDMSKLGYEPFIKSQFLEINHLILALESLAQFHALSFILKQREPILYMNVTNVCHPLTASNNMRYINILRDRLEKAIIKFEGSKYVELFERLNKRCEAYIESMSGDTQGLCICHGDVWKENLLYKYKDTVSRQPVSACLLDYQTARECSPASDVLYLIISSTNSKLRQQHYYQLLSSYYQAFDRCLALAGLNSSTVYSREMLDEDLKVVSPACLIIANTALWLANGLQQEGHVRSKQVFNNKEEYDLAADRYKTIISNIVNDLISYGYLNDV